MAPKGQSPIFHMICPRYGGPLTPTAQIFQYLQISRRQQTIASININSGIDWNATCYERWMAEWGGRGRGWGRGNETGFTETQSSL